MRRWPVLKLDLWRKWETARSITGLLGVDGQFECYTLEGSRTTPVHPDHPCIAAGIYQVILTPSPHLGYVTPELVQVLGRSKIRIHIGNRPEDVEGCIAVGQGHNTDWVSQSELAFEKLMTLLKTADDGLTIEIHDPGSSDALH